MLEKQVSVDRLEDKLKELEQLDGSLDVTQEIESLRNRIRELKQDIWDHLEPWDRVQLARKAGRLTAMDYIQRLFEDFTELHGDRLFGDDHAIVGGIARFQGRPVTVIGQQKGHTTRENIERNFGMPNPEGYRKALRLMKQAEKFGRPVVCLIDTPGAFCGLGAEERGQGEAIARNLYEMSALTIPVLAVVIGEGGSGGALALAMGNEVWMLENAVYSVLSPEGFASILWKDSKRAKEAAGIMKITAGDLYGLGIIEQVIKEPVGGMDENSDIILDGLKSKLQDFFARMDEKSRDQLAEERYQKFRKIYS